MIVSIIIPCFNEERTIKKILNKIYLLKKIQKQIIVVDDGSTDTSKKIILEQKKKKKNEIVLNRKNLGKGASIKKAKKLAKGEIIIIQDADLEYNPQDLYSLIDPIKKNKTQVVYGSRVLGKNNRKLKFQEKFRVFGNYLLTKFSNLINNQNLTDAHTCYKVFHKNVFNKIDLIEKGFSFCPEVTTKLSNLKVNILEVPISYFGRNYKDGKKIRFIDAFRALFTILKYKFS